MRNYGNDDYIEKDNKKRKIDHPNGFPRLNENMVRKFFDPLPAKNKGEFLEVPNLPHAFKRDGDIDTNYEKMTELLFKLLNH